MADIGRLKIYEGGTWHYAGYGIQGQSGYSGSDGYSGYSGTNGYSGYSGFDAPTVVSINEQTSSYGLLLADAEKLVDMNSASAINLFVPEYGSVAFPIGTTIVVRQKGLGQVTIVPSGAVTIDYPDGLKMIGQYTMASLIKVDTNTWSAVGSLEA